MFLRKKKYLVLKDDSKEPETEKSSETQETAPKKTPIAKKHKKVKQANCAVCNRAIDRNSEYIVILKNREKQNNATDSREMVLVCSEECYKDFELYYVVKSSKKMIRILG
jgi:hypothetical protein